MGRPESSSPSVVQFESCSLLVEPPEQKVRSNPPRFSAHGFDISLVILKEEYFLYQILKEPSVLHFRWFQMF